MRELFPDESSRGLFSHRFTPSIPQGPTFDPTTVRLLISLKTQLRPVIPSIEARASPPAVPQNDSPAPFSPRPANAHLSISDTMPRLSPKRPLGYEATDDARAHKVARGESPFKGAAGRRVNAAKGGSSHIQSGPPPLPRDVNIMLSILPRAEVSRHLRTNNQALMTLLRHVNLTQLQHHQGMQRGTSSQGYQGGHHGAYGAR